MLSANFNDIIIIIINFNYIRRNVIFKTYPNNCYYRIIDELRSTVAGKAHFPFADVSCSSPPCYKDLDVNWRI